MQNSTSLSTETTDLPVDDRPTRRVGYLILFLTFGLFGGWATLAPLDSAALAPGVVTVKSYRKTVQHLEGGIVRELRVRDGDQVKTGDVLMVLDNTQARSEMEMMRSQLIAAQELEARLVAERDGLPAPLPVPGLNPEDPRVREAHDSEARIFQTRRTSLLGEIGLQEQSIGQIEQQIRGFKAIIASKQSLGPAPMKKRSSTCALCSPKATWTNYACATRNAVSPAYRPKWPNSNRKAPAPPCRSAKPS